MTFQATRRGFLGGLLAVVAPAIVRAPNLMPLNGVPLSKILSSPWEDWAVRWAVKRVTSNLGDTVYTMRGVGGRQFEVHAPAEAYRVGQIIRVFRD